MVLPKAMRRHWRSSLAVRGLCHKVIAVTSVDVVQQAEQADLGAASSPVRALSGSSCTVARAPRRQMGGQLFQRQVQARRRWASRTQRSDSVGLAKAVGIELAGADPGIQAGDPGLIEATRLTIEGDQCLAVLIDVTEALLAKIGDHVHLLGDQRQQRCTRRGEAARRAAGW